MSLSESIRSDLKSAIQSKDEKRVATLRLLIAAVQNKEIEERKKDVGLSDEEMISVIQKEAKKRRDAMAEYTNAGRKDRADIEEKELRILEEYLPKELSDDEIVRIIKDGVRESGAEGSKDFGALMKVIMPILKTRASGDRIAQLARGILENL